MSSNVVSFEKATIHSDSDLTITFYDASGKKNTLSNGQIISGNINKISASGYDSVFKADGSADFKHTTVVFEGM